MQSAAVPSESPPSRVTVTRGSMLPLDDDLNDIPVLEATKNGAFYSDDDEEDDDDDDSDDDDDEFVPVLQTAEDAQRSEQLRMTKTFSWSVGTRSTALGRRSSTRSMISAQPLRPQSSASFHYGPRQSQQQQQQLRPDRFAHSMSNVPAPKPSSTNTDRQLVRSGWLLKQGNMWRSWKRRFFVLIKRTNTSTGEFTATLQHYKDNKFKKLRGEIHLQEGPWTIRFLDVSEHKKPYCFEISKSAEFSLVCQCMDDEDVSAWVCHLQSLADNKIESTAIQATSRMLSDSISTNSTGTYANSGSSNGAPRSMKRGRTATAMDDRGICLVAELRRLLYNAKSSEAAKCKEFVKNVDFRGNPLRQIREFHANLSESIMKNHGERILKLVDEKKQLSENLMEGLEDIGLDEIRASVSRHVEEVIYVPSQEGIANYLSRLCIEDEPAMNRKLRWLQGKDQAYFNIPLHHVSWKEWRKASKILSKMSANTLPTAKYDVILNTIKEIQATYAEEHSVSDTTNSAPLETDDIIPIFTYVLANSGLDNLLALKVLLTELNGAWAVGGLSDDEGTGLSIFAAAVEFVKDVTIPAALEDIFKDQVTLSIDGDWRRIVDFEIEPTYRYGAIVAQVLPHGYAAVGSTIARGHVLVAINGQNVVLWPYPDISTLLKESTAPHRLAFIPGSSYFKILTSNKSLWNVALVHACQRGDIASVQMLLANGADVNYVAHECGGNTPLHIAASALHFSVVSYLLQHGAKVRTIGEYGRSALHMVGAPCCMPSTCSASTTATMPTSSTQRQRATKYRPEEQVILIIRKLLSHSVSTEIVDIYGNTPLMLLAERGFVDGIDALMEANGALDINRRNWHQGMSALALAAREGRTDAIAALLDYGAAVDTRSLNGETPLHFAAAIASKAICKLLVDKGSDIDARTVRGLTPLMVAVARGHGVTKRIEHATTAKDKGKHRKSLPFGTMDNRWSMRRSSLDSASVVETIEYLLVHGADKESVCDLYRLPLHYAALYGGPVTFEYLLKNHMNQDVDGHMRDIYGQTAISMLAQSNEEDGVTMDLSLEEQEDKLLVGNEAPVSYEDVLTEEKDGGLREIVAGTFENIASIVLRWEDYQIDEVDALIRYCDYCGKYKDMIDFLRRLLNKHARTLKGFFVRRMVLHALDKIVGNIKHRVHCDLDVCRYISDFCDELFPFNMEDDPQCAQWLSSSSLLPAFVDACRSHQMHEFQRVMSCVQDYTGVQQFAAAAKLKNPALLFLDDDLSTQNEVDAISESMRRRLAIAGVWSNDSNQSSGTKHTGGSASMSSPSKLVARASALDRLARIWILDVDPNVMAQQLTLLQHYFFRQIKISEVLASKKSSTTTPAFDRLRQLHNHISMYVVNQILARDECMQRAQVLSYFIQVASACLHPLQNLDGFMAVMNATNDSSIFRLKKTWGKLQSEAKEQWHGLKKWTENGARPLNRLMKHMTPPCLPYMGVVIQNVLALQEYPDTVDGGLINFKKSRFLCGLIHNLLTCQETSYLMPMESRVLDHLCSSLAYGDAESCFARSLTIEPRVAGPTKSRR